MYQTRHTFASNAWPQARRPPGWRRCWDMRALRCSSASPRYIPNRTRRDGSALMPRMEGTETATKSAEEAAAVLPKYSR
jgi:hypothetical protein